MIGKMLGNRYEVLEKIGGGGMAVVYKAKCHLLNRHVAVKVLRDDFIHDKDLVNKFKRESQAVASLSHPNIVNVYDVGEIDEVYYIVMEMVSGKTLKRVIREKGTLAEEQVIDYAKQIASALQHAHNNYVVHRDIKPQNILITDDDRAKVTDFGIALSSNASTLTNTGSLVGSVHYFSPEQARGGYTDAKTDLYSLGIVMYEMATGQVPFEGESPVTVALKHLHQDMAPPTELNPEISEGLEAIIVKLTQKEQSLRYQSAGALIDALKQLETDPEYVPEELEEEIDENPTQVNKMRKGEANSHMMRNKSTRKKKGSKVRFVIAAGIITAMLASLVFVAGFFLMPRLFVPRSEITLPDLTNMTLDEAREELETLGLQYLIEYRFDEEFEENRIISQNPAPGRNVRENFPVELLVSTYENAGEVPDVIYSTLDDARFLLDDAGFTVGELEYVFSDLPQGTVIRQTPRAGDAHVDGGAVDLIISEGPEVAMIPMPSVVGVQFDSAKETLELLDLKVIDFREEYSNEYVEGIVIGQSVPAEREVAEGTSIVLTISKGPETIQVEDPILEPVDPEEIDEPDDPSEEPAEEQPMTTKSMNIGPLGQSGIVEVRLYRLDSEQRTLIFSKTHNIDEEGDRLQVTVRGSGVQQYEIEIDGQVAQRVEVVF